MGPSMAEVGQRASEHGITDRNRAIMWTTLKADATWRGVCATLESMDILQPSDWPAIPQQGAALTSVSAKGCTGCVVC